MGTYDVFPGRRPHVNPAPEEQWGGYAGYGSVHRQTPHRKRGDGYVNATTMVVKNPRSGTYVSSIFDFSEGDAMPHRGCFADSFLLGWFADSFLLGEDGAGCHGTHKKRRGKKKSVCC